MRKNLPVTQNIYSYPENQTLISITDLKGRITYCNDDFVKVSGYQREELLGQAHNILRHPDVPEEAFRDFWETIQSGKIWSSILKNRRKNGDAYWVRANATPVRHGDRIVGYLSVRTLPAQDEIVQTERLFAVMRQEAAQAVGRGRQGGRRLRHRFYGGVLRRKGWAGFGDVVAHPGPMLRTGVLVALSATGAPAVRLLGLPDGPARTQALQRLQGIACMYADIAGIELKRHVAQRANGSGILFYHLYMGDAV